MRRALHLGTGLFALLASATLLAAPEGGAARVSLLPAGARASVVVELDDATAGATAIEATDNQTVAVEIGPIRGKVVNQLLQAAADSPLVSQVRVRGVTQGTAGTIVTIHIVAKAPVSGSVRRTPRRIYIDLAPRTTSPPSAADAGPRNVREPQPGRPPAPAKPAQSVPAAAPVTPTSPARSPVPVSTKPAIVPAAPVRANTSPASPGPTPAPQPASTARVAPPANVVPPAAAAATTGAVPPPYPSRLGPPPERARAVADDTTAPPPVAVATSSQPAGQPAATTTSLIEFEARAARLVQGADVRGLSRLKTEIEARKIAATSQGQAGGGDFDGLINRVDQFIDAAQRNRLAADAELFRGAGAAAPSPASPSPAAASTVTATVDANPGGSTATRPLAIPPPPPVSEAVATPLPGGPANVLSPAAAHAATAQAVPDFTAEFRPVRPQLEQLGKAARTWRETSPSPQDLAAVSAVLAQLRSLHPPTQLAASFSNLRTSLELLELWGGAARTPTPSEVALVERARQAIESFLVLDRQNSQIAQ